MKNVIRYLNFLNDSKHLVGLSDWQIRINEKAVQTDYLAQAIPDIFEKIVFIDLTDKFLESTEAQKRNILIHELVHVRYVIKEQIQDKMTEFLEEDLINDIVRGLEICKIPKLKKK